MKILGIDAGNTMIKAVLFDLSGTILAVAEHSGETLQPQEGYAERSIAAIRHGTEQAIRHCLLQAGTDAQDIIAVGAAGHGNGLYTLDRALQPQLGIQSIDRRADDIVAALEQAEKQHAIYTLSRQTP